MAPIFLMGKKAALPAFCLRHLTDFRFVLKRTYHNRKTSAKKADSQVKFSLHAPGEAVSVKVIS